MHACRGAIALLSPRSVRSGTRTAGLLARLVDPRPHRHRRTDPRTAAGLERPPCSSSVCRRSLSRLHHRCEPRSPVCTKAPRTARTCTLLSAPLRQQASARPRCAAPPMIRSVRPAIPGRHSGLRARRMPHAASATQRAARRDSPARPAVQESRATGCPQIGPEHLCLALCKSSNTGGLRTVKACGAAPGTRRVRLRAELPSPTLTLVVQAGRGHASDAARGAAAHQDGARGHRGGRRRSAHPAHEPAVSPRDVLGRVSRHVAPRRAA